ncbi:hypothetical protein CLOM_g259 [Closterium sp. NIES-68]|nr:hypothetical protein CLOM_g259 [Closterium sp. NIES-68]GJP77729.1 hypothetical protein CLOP_g8085 [Closterium sp. NIES-67]
MSGRSGGWRKCLEQVKKQLLGRKLGKHAEVGMPQTMVVKNDWVSELTAGARWGGGGRVRLSGRWRYFECVEVVGRHCEVCKEGIVGGVKEIRVVRVSREDGGYPCSLNLMLCK